MSGVWYRIYQNKFTDFNLTCTNINIVFNQEIRHINVDNAMLQVISKAMLCKKKQKKTLIKTKLIKTIIWVMGNSWYKIHPKCILCLKLIVFTTES